MRGLGILLLIVLFFWIVWPIISRWIKRKALERAEDYMRASMGMPPRDRKHGNSQQRNREYGYNQSRTHQYHEQHSGPIIPKEYAEDVEFTETIDYSHTETHTTISSGGEIYHESQISDVEFVEIKKSGSK